MAIPSFDATGNLPPGIHAATWPELATRFGFSPKRVQLLDGLRRGLEALKKAGCQLVYVDGSFVTEKDNPGDFDACWEAAGVNPALLDPVLLDFNNRRAAQKAKFGGEFFVAAAASTPTGTTFLDFFQRDKSTGDPKGIVSINLGGFS